MIGCPISFIYAALRGVALFYTRMHACFEVYCNYHCVRIASDILFHPSIHLHCIAQDLIAPLDLMRFTAVSFVYYSQVMQQ